MTQRVQQEVLLEARDLTVGYGHTRVVEGISFSALSGSIVSLIGPNGAGKSTMLKTFAGYLRPLAGSVSLCGEDLQRLDNTRRSRLMSVLLTDRVRTELLTCADIVEAGRYPYTGHLGVSTREDLRKVRAAMELVKVWDLRDRDFMQLSDGQRQRVMLARAICQEPRVMVLDEPTSHLDIRYQIELLDVLHHLAHEQGVAIVMTMHELPLARRISDWVICVKDGGVALQGAPAEVFVPTVIDDLYDLKPGTFDSLTGDVALFMGTQPVATWEGGPRAST